MKSTIFKCGFAFGALLIGLVFFKVTKFFAPYWTIEHCLFVEDMIGARNWCKNHGDIDLAQELISKRFEKGGASRLIEALTKLRPTDLAEQRLLAENYRAASAYVENHSKASIALVHRLRLDLIHHDEEVRLMAACSLGNLEDEECFEYILSMSRPQSDKNFVIWMDAIASYRDPRALAFLKECEQSDKRRIVINAKERMEYRRIIGFDK
jgi:hypothetical protein